MPDPSPSKVSQKQGTDNSDPTVQTSDTWQNVPRQATQAQVENPYSSNSYDDLRRRLATTPPCDEDRLLRPKLTAGDPSKAFFDSLALRLSGPVNTVTKAQRPTPEGLSIRDRSSSDADDELFGEVKRTQTSNSLAVDRCGLTTTP
jgi:hypothetical protein